MKLKNIKLFIPALLLMIGMASCADDLNIGPIDPSVDLNFKQDEVFNKLYATLGLTGPQGPDNGDDGGDVAGIDEGTSAFYRLTFTINEYPTDELLCAWMGDPGIPEMSYIRWGSSVGMIEGLYGRLCYDITLCNHFLEKTDGMTDDNTVRQRAEARFIRALNYFYLMDVFANPPFAEEVSTELTPQIKRADLFTYIETELKAIDPDLYDAKQAPFGRADKVAAWLLLSRLYLNAEVYTGTAHWTDAAAYANKVMTSGYGLCSNYSHLFMADNDQNADAMKEIILPIRQDGKTTRSWGGSQFLIASTYDSDMPDISGTTDKWSGNRARKALIDKFFPGGNAPLTADEAAMVATAVDDRALFYAGGIRTLEIDKVEDFKQGFSVTKWKNVRSDGGATHDAEFADTDIPFFRLAEAYLTFAEATVRAGGDAAAALKAVNDLRDRAHASKLANLTLDNILDERSREFYFEGQRRMDLVRYGYFTSNQYLWDWKGGQKAGTAVNSIYNICPIPASDLNANNNLVQNPGY
jgi:hypothetical protein